MNNNFKWLALVSDIHILNMMPSNMHESFIDMRIMIYKDYPKIAQSMIKFNKQSITYLYNEIKIKTTQNIPYHIIINNYPNDRSMVIYILDCLEYKTESIETITLHDNQIKAITNTVENDFNSGIHSQATGSGKSIIALKIIKEFNQKYPNKHVLWTCERKDIPQKLFFHKKDNIIIPNHQQFEIWKQNDIIDMSKFTIKEFVYNKNKKWIKEINNHKSDKPLFLIINRAFLTSKSKIPNHEYKYEDIKNRAELIILDECHSAMACNTYQMLLYFKYNWKAKIQGFSATPYRKGKSYTTINIQIDYPEADKDKILVSENENKLVQIFAKPNNTTELNILSWFNMKEAIENNIILEPIFHWYRVNNYGIQNENVDENNEPKYENIYDITEIDSAMCVLDEIMLKCQYKKGIAWCRLMSTADEWFAIFEKEKTKYDNLKHIKAFIDHSNVIPSDDNYDKFYELADSAIIFCASKFREGSDIPYLNFCIFLDKVRTRGELPFIQCIGRVLRNDKYKIKQNGHIIDGCTIDNDNDIIKSIVNKIIKYYLHLYEFTKSDFMNVTNNDKIILYDKIIKSLKLKPENNEIIIELNDDKKIVIDIGKIDMKSLCWNKIIPSFGELLKDTIILSDYEEYIMFRDKVRKLNIKTDCEYDIKYLEYGLYDMNKKKIIPSKRFATYFKGWYEFLGIDTTKFIESYDAWKNKCEQLGLTQDNYFDKCVEYEDMPSMPREFYKGHLNFGEIFCGKANKYKKN